MQSDSLRDYGESSHLLEHATMKDESSESDSESESEEELALLRVLIGHLIRNGTSFLPRLKRAGNWILIAVNWVNLVKFSGLRPGGSYSMSQLLLRRFFKILCHLTKFILFLVFLDLLGKILRNFRRFSQTTEFSLGLHG